MSSSACAQREPRQARYRRALIGTSQTPGETRVFIDPTQSGREEREPPPSVSQHQNSSAGTRSPLLRAIGQPALPHPAIGAPTLQPDEPRSCHRATGIPPAASAASVLTAAGVPGPEAVGGTPEELRGADPLLPAADLPPAQRSPRDLGPRFPLCEADLSLLPHSIQRAGGRESSAGHLAHGSTQEMGASS